MMETSEELFGQLQDLVTVLELKGEGEFAERLRDALAGSTGGEVLGASRDVLRSIRKGDCYRDQRVCALVDPCLEVINKSLGGWWRG